MSSQHKKNKVRNAYAWGGALKHKGAHLKGFLFFTSAQRRANNKFDIQNENETA